MFPVLGSGFGGCSRLVVFVCGLQWGELCLGSF